MKTYEEIVQSYKKRQKDTVVDSLATGVTYMDEICVDSGLLEEAGLMGELTSTVCSALPFVIIAATEGTKIILGRKPARNGTKDAAARMIKTGAAIGVGAAVTAAAGFWAAIPATMGVRALFDKYKSKSLEQVRVKQRIKRLHALYDQLYEEKTPERIEEAFPDAIPVDADCT